MKTLIMLIVVGVCCHVSQQSTNTPPAPVLTMLNLNVELNEKEKRQYDLNLGQPILTCADADQDQTRAYIQSVTPSSPCGAKCFQLQPCGTNESEYCLFFLPTEGSLIYAVASGYSLKVACTDDLEPVSTSSMTVTIKSNSPPYFDPPSPIEYIPIKGDATPADTVVYDANAIDDDGDPVRYTIATLPGTNLLDIGKTSGKVYAMNDLKFLCQDKVTATIRATDDINTKMATKTVEFTLSPYNQPPLISNLDSIKDTLVEVKENQPAGTTVLALTLVNDGIGTVRYKVTSVPDFGLELYEVKNGAVVTKEILNYERTDTQQSVKLYIEATDGYCTSPTYSMTVNIVDDNDPPVIQPLKMTHIDVYEESFVITPGFLVTDEDENEVLKYSLTGSAKFTTEPDVGDIISASAIDVDPGKEFQPFPLTYIVTDSRGKSTTATVTVNVYDVNDNAPVFAQTQYTLAVTECTEVGTSIGKVSATDKDSIYQNNNKIIYGGGGDRMAIMSGGTVILTQACIAGETFTGTATAKDQGEYPGPLTGDSVPLTMKCNPCPSTLPPPTTTTRKPTTKASIPTTTGALIKRTFDFSDILPWLIPAIIGASIWLALLSYMIYRFCFPCKNPCQGRCVSRPKSPKVEPEPTKKSPPPEKPTKETPPKKSDPPPPVKTPPQAPPPVVPPKPEPTPYLFGFWKEQYTDQDFQTQQPARAVKPQPIESMPPPEVVPRGNAIPPENLKLGNPGPGQINPPASNAAPPVAPQASKNSSCIIL
ncbi:protocadherin Fat 4-like [Physella acuta]|uniref:protocadherin Fat 4-like n=1 Tax=Physella acuta TaxID=109671 RepID=UPI0027DB26A8|nr:protocadherin Fat 4-like [Physella acuta]